MHELQNAALCSPVDSEEDLTFFFFYEIKMLYNRDYVRFITFCSYYHNH